MERNEKNLPPHRAPVLPDKELLVWEKWIQIRRDEVNRLAEKVDREPVDLAMNLLDKVRPDKERKTALEYAQIEKKVGVRGALWERPPRLKQRCYCAPTYELHRTRAELGRPRIIEHIGVPDYLKEHEFGMTGEPQRLPFRNLNYKYNEYRNEREDELYYSLIKVDPLRPQMRDLIVLGEAPTKPPKQIPPLPLINIEAPTNFPVEPLSGVYAMKINNTVFYKDVPGQKLVHLSTFHQNSSHENCNAWTYYFNVPVKRAGRSKLFLQNLGTVTLRYCWKKLKRIVPFIPDEGISQVFFFNKNEDVLPPGQSKEIPITFISDQPGIYNEFWELSLSNINFFDTLTEKHTINLYADSVENVDLIRRKVEILKTRINRKAVNNLAAEFVNEIFENIFAVVPQIYPYKKFFLEAEIFVMKNPVCFYHQTEVAKMKELYTEMYKHGVWDLSIETWRHMMMSKEFEERMKYYELLRKSHSELLKPWYEGEELLKEKHRAVKCLLMQLAEKFDKEFENLKETYTPKVEAPLATTSTILRGKSKSKITQEVDPDPATQLMINNIFYVRVYEHVANTIELCAGVLSSLDLNRWIEFDFCRRFY